MLTHINKIDPNTSIEYVFSKLTILLVDTSTCFIAIHIVSKIRCPNVCMSGSFIGMYVHYIYSYPI